MNTGKGYVDLIDAQSQYVPLHFQTRIKAEGARDYGEDVADRNLGENGFDLTSPQAQAFYALTGTNPPSDASLFVSPLRLNKSQNHKTDDGYDSPDESDDWVDHYELPTAANPPVSLPRQ
ncbi:hypothetical protein ACHAO2_002972 [Verticillium nonalfalfae]